MLKTAVRIALFGFCGAALSVLPGQWISHGQKAPAPDVGMITQLSGEVLYSSEEDAKAPAPAQTFMKIRQGDQLKLSGKALVQLLYLANGRQETWKGPVTFIVGSSESLTPGDGKLVVQPEVKILPAKITKRMGTALLPLPGSNIRYSGAIQTMSARPPEPGTSKVQRLSEEKTDQDLEEAAETYRHLRKNSPKDDATPELYYLSVLADHGKYPEMEKVLDGLLAKKPGDATLKDLKAWVRSQSLKRDQPVRAK